jgi:hypothetical protein
VGTSTNEHTGSRMASKPSTDKYRDNWDSIFGKKQEEDVIDNNSTIGGESGR